MGGLIASVSELEQQQKQRAELGDWIKKQQGSVADWLTRPCKLRPEAAKQELVTMNDLLGAIGDKRSQLMLEMTGSRKLIFELYLDKRILLFLLRQILQLRDNIGRDLLGNTISILVGLCQFT